MSILDAHSFMHNEGCTLIFHIVEIYLTIIIVNIVMATTTVPATAKDATISEDEAALIGNDSRFSSSIHAFKHTGGAIGVVEMH